jgi:potassium-dependent mechanosensitive channel
MRRHRMNRKCFKMISYGCCLILVLCLAGSPDLASGQENALNLKMDQPAENNTFEAWPKPWQQKRLPLDGLTWTKIADDVEGLRQVLADNASPKTLSTELREVIRSHGTSGLIFFTLLGVTLYLLNKTRLYLKGVTGRIEQERFRVRHRSLFIVRRSILLAGATLFVYLYLLTSPTPPVLECLKLLASILTVALFTKWARFFARYCLLEQNWIQTSDNACISMMLTGVRYGVIFYLGLLGLTGAASTLPVVLSVFMKLFLLMWTIYFWRNYHKGKTTPAGKSTRRKTTILSICKAISYAIIGGGIVMDLLGYGSFSIYWYASWGKSLIIVLWGGLFLLILREWRQELKIQAADVDLYEDATGQPFKWFLLQLSGLGGFGVFLVLLIFAWGGRQAVIVNIVQTLNYPFSIGEIHFSIMNLIKAVIVLILTHTLARFWRLVLREKMLADSGLDTGLQDSITMISVYAVWAFGIMLSLHTFGLGTTTLALAFGALGIGLGFGLQNIFNNFISGIILLFERPIQVGDDVEINGVWATVKKINVRATVVQTYDNASIIIPNSEFISSQVTNWSFKDKRLRRSIDVGVAYGSDIEAVRRILLEIGDNTHMVFKNPKPDVIFRDFGDSALIFRLRVWTDIDNMLKVDTAIRFEIDKRFKKQGIVIAFPQRDVHLFTEGASGDAGATGQEETPK